MVSARTVWRVADLPVAGPIRVCHPVHPLEPVDQASNPVEAPPKACVMAGGVSNLPNRWVGPLALPPSPAMPRLVISDQPRACRCRCFHCWRQNNGGWRTRPSPWSHRRTLPLACPPALMQLRRTLVQSTRPSPSRAPDSAVSAHSMSSLRHDQGTSSIVARLPFFRA